MALQESFSCVLTSWPNVLVHGRWEIVVCPRVTLDSRRITRAAVVGIGHHRPRTLGWPRVIIRAAVVRTGHYETNLRLAHIDASTECVGSWRIIRSSVVRMAVLISNALRSVHSKNVGREAGNEHLAQVAFVVVDQ